MSTTETTSELQRQREYTQQLKDSGFDWGLTVGAAFVRGIRDIGYKSTATALDEVIDNPEQAGATKIHVAFGYGPASDKKPDKLAIIDNGHGMDPDMIRVSTLWGGTHRENDRKGFGRYGYGLPSACVSQGERFTVYSRPPGGEWHAVTLDLKEISDGRYTNNHGRIVVPEATPEKLPAWIQRYVDTHFGGPLEYGTVVEISRLDRLTWKTSKALKEKLLEHFGVTYRNFLREFDLFVDGTQVQATDPLFLTPGMRFYDLDDDRAEALPPLAIKVKDKEKADDGSGLGAVTVRFAYLPPTFARKDKASGRGENNARFPVMKDHNGIVVLRNGRQIDVVNTDCPWTTFLNNDRYWKVEVDFPPTLDEEFSISTSKQRVGLSDRMWEILRENGVFNAISAFRARYKRESAELKVESENAEGQVKPSEKAMEEAEEFKTRKQEGDSEERQRRAQEALRREAERRAREGRRSQEEAERDLEAEIEGQPYRVAREALIGAPFYRVEQMGGQKVLSLNTAHRFFADVYMGPGSNPRSRAGLEVLLFVMGECELDASDQRSQFYQTERAEWSNRLNVALDRLNSIEPIERNEHEDFTGDNVA